MENFDHRSILVDSGTILCNGASYVPMYTQIDQMSATCSDSCLSLSEHQLPYKESQLLGSGWMPRSRTNMIVEAFNRKNETSFALCTDPWWYKSPWPERAKAYKRLDGVKEFVHIWAVIIQPAFSQKVSAADPASFASSCLEPMFDSKKIWL